ncbi:PREDICTED: uncharacterized protein LOC109228621 [Nicotiana attenuata]|uniref:Uncharacterized protein n=1 Tax=Nicotiana attenuata TaxID=49451 RepID=A0A1J6I6F3_NICAT|nr:PREDICTED: uncharacterized protein LOC109228621 [Nicotiana attenuata]OIT00044.1 hypothetical protein A4A49_02640 [Nicotiana attenuata]
MKMNNTYKDLHNLTERAGILHDKITERIYNEGLHFCRDCAEHGRYCGIADLRIEDKEKLIAIRDSLKEIQNMLEFYQTLQSRQQRLYNGAVARLEESRMLLLEKINKYPTWGSKLVLIEELRECLVEGKVAFSENLAETKEKQIQDKKKKNKNSSFLVICIRGLFNPRNWFRTTRIAAVALIVASASISSPFNLYKNKLQIKENISVSRMKIDYPHCQLAVSYGKG